MTVIKNISYFFAAAVLSKPLGFLLSLILAKALGPADFGVWVTLMLVASYSPIVCLGTVETLLKQVPFYSGRGESHNIHEVEDSVMGSVAIASAIVISVALVSWCILPSISWGINTFLLVMMFMASAVSFVSAYFYNRFAAYENFKAAGTMDFLRSALALLFVGGMAWIWGLRGAVIGYLIHETTTCFLTALINIHTQGIVGIVFRRDLLIQAVRVGFPITLLWWVLTLTGTVDRVVLGSLLGPLAVGHYGLAISVVNVLYLLPMVVGRVLYPKVNKQFGQDSGSASMRHVMLAPTLALGAMLANLQLALLVIMPFLYNQLLPKYQPGLKAGEILMLGSFFACLMRNGANYLIAINQQRVFLKYIVVTLAFNIVSDVSLVKAGFGISGVALGTSFAGLLLTSFVWRKVLLSLDYLPRQVWAKLTTLYLPFIVLLTLASAWCLINNSAFQVFNGLEIAIGISLFILLNGSLYCLPVYRSEMKSWIRTFLKSWAAYRQRVERAATTS